MLRFLLRRLLITLVISLLLAYLLWLLTTIQGTAVLEHPTISLLTVGPFWPWLNQILHGDFGYSIRLHGSVLPGIRDHLLASLLIIIPAFLLQEVLAVAIGIISAARQRSVVDRVALIFVAVCAAVPPFWFGLTMLIVLAVNTHIVPFGGLVSLQTTGTEFNTPQYWVYFQSHTWAAIQGLAWHLVLPVMTLALLGLASDSQLVRASMIDVLKQEYIRAARARGLRRRTILWKHAFRNAVLPVISSIGTQLPRLIFGAAIIELVFQIPGLGNLFIVAAYTPPRESITGSVSSIPQDPNLVTSYFLILGVVTILASLVTDIAYALADPRIRDSGGNAVIQSTARQTSLRTVRLVGRSIPVRTLSGGLVTATLVIIAGVLLISNLLNRARTSPTAIIQGSWVGQVKYKDGFFSSGTDYLYVDIHVGQDGKISGQAIECAQAAFQTPLETYTLGGQTDSSGAVQLLMTTQTDVVSYTALAPDTGKPWPMQGIANRMQQQSAVSVVLQHDTLAKFQQLCQTPPPQG